MKNRHCDDGQGYSKKQRMRDSGDRRTYEYHTTLESESSAGATEAAVKAETSERVRSRRDDPDGAAVGVRDCADPTGELAMAA